MKFRFFLTASLILIAAVTSEATTRPSLFEFNSADFEIINDGAGQTIVLDGQAAAGVGYLPTISQWYSVEAGSFDSLSWSTDDAFSLGVQSLNPEPDITTFAGDDYLPADYYDAKLRQQPSAPRPAVTWERMYKGSQELILVTIAPLQRDETSGEVTCIGELELTWHGDEALRVESCDDRFAAQPAPRIRRAGAVSGSASPQYLIVTNAELMPAFAPLRLWKEQKGLTADIVRIDDITALQDGVDDAERLRNYLISAHQQGTEYVLLGGDETVVPIRYAHDRDRDDMPDAELMQICDLYFADLTGDWDSDGDGLYGEPGDDHPDIIPEIKVGRLLANTPAEVRIYVEKLIGYEQNPGAGEYDYLNQSLFVAADQMRDYHEVGQHQLLADALPASVEADVNLLIESPSGNADNPASPSVGDALDRLSEGCGLLSLLIHGVAEGWVLRSHDYNQWPKSYIYTVPSAGGDHGYLPDMTASHKPGIVYSVGCSNGAFDKDASPWPGRNPCVAEAFLLQENGGAVAFVGYSRWGWVSSSWKLEKSFLEYIYGQDANVAAALAYSKLQYPTYRDLAYGLNLYGDPELEMWTSTPAPLTVETPELTSLGFNDVTITVRDGALPCSGALVSVVEDSEIIAQMVTGGNGTVSVTLDYSADPVFEVLAYKEGHAVATAILTPSISLNADDELTIPDEFSLEQNFPNPFNPTTQITFNLSRPSQVQLEVFNLLGQRVALLSNEWLMSGSHQHTWDGRSDAGEEQPSGVYFARLQAGERSDVIKMTLLK